MEEILPLLPSQRTYEVLDFGLHSNPEKMRVRLQEAIDASPPSIGTILLGLSLCSKSVIGLKSDNCRIVIPKADDCITIFLGSEAYYSQQQRMEPGTLYLTKGWIEAGTPLDKQRDLLAEKYGDKKAEILFKKMLQGYKRLVFIDTGNYEQKRYKAHSQEMADRLNLRYEEIKGNNLLILKLLNGHWDEDFVVAAPGHTIALSDFRKF